jgi:hypothetical protein
LFGTHGVKARKGPNGYSRQRTKTDHAARDLGATCPASTAAAARFAAITTTDQHTKLIFGLVDYFIKFRDLRIIIRTASAIAIAISIRAKTVVVIVAIISSAPPGAAIISSH